MTNASGVHQISAAELKTKLDAGQPLFLIDVRNHEEAATWKIEAAQAIPGIHVPYFEMLEVVDDVDDLADAFVQYAQAHWTELLPQDSFILVVCAKGGTSEYVAEGLSRLGYNAANLSGGMIAWGNFYQAKPVTEQADLQIHQIGRPARGCLSYLLASEGEAVVVDPLRHISEYVHLAEAKGLKIVAVLDTHGHADHISGGPAMAEKLQVPYYVHPYDAIHPLDMLPATISYEPLRAGQELRFGSAVLKVLHIPGHTLGNIAYLVNNSYLLSGDSIFVESIARPDLGGKGEAWSPLHYRSLSALTSLPDHLMVLPGHFSNPTEANDQGLFARTLGELKTKNEGLLKLAMGEEAFTSYLLSSLPTFPQQYVDIKRVNAGLLTPDEEKASELELGKNICALSQAYDEKEESK